MTQPRDVALITTEPSRRRASRALWFAGHPLRNQSFPDHVRWLSYHFEAPGEIEPGQAFPCLHWPVIPRPEASSLVLRGILVDQAALRTSACVILRNGGAERDLLRNGGAERDLGRVEDLIWDGVRQPPPLAIEVAPDGHGVLPIVAKLEVFERIKLCDPFSVLWFFEVASSQANP